MHWDDDGTLLKKSFIQLPILCANSQAVAFSVLWGRRSYFCVGQSTLYFPQSWELMRFVSLLHYNTSDSPFLRLSWLLITPGQRTGVVPPILLRRGHNVPVWSTHANFHHLEKLHKGCLHILLSVFSVLSLFKGCSETERNRAHPCDAPSFPHLWQWHWVILSGFTFS